MAFWRELYIARNLKGGVSDHHDLSWQNSSAGCSSAVQGRRHRPRAPIPGCIAPGRARAEPGLDNRIAPDAVVRLAPETGPECRLQHQSGALYGMEPLPEKYHPLVNARFREVERALAVTSANYFKQQPSQARHAVAQAQGQA